MQLNVTGSNLKTLRTQGLSKNLFLGKKRRQSFMARVKVLYFTNASHLLAGLVDGSLIRGPLGKHAGDGLNF